MHLHQRINDHTLHFYPEALVAHAGVLDSFHYSAHDSSAGSIEAEVTIVTAKSSTAPVRPVGIAGYAARLSTDSLIDFGRWAAFPGMHSEVCCRILLDTGFGHALHHQVATDSQAWLCSQCHMLQIYVGVSGAPSIHILHRDHAERLGCNGPLFEKAMKTRWNEHAGRHCMEFQDEPHIPGDVHAPHDSWSIQRHVQPEAGKFASGVPLSSRPATS